MHSSSVASRRGFLPALGVHLLEVLCSSFYPGVMAILDSKVCFLDAAQRWALFSNPICYSVYFIWESGTDKQGRLKLVCILLWIETI